MQGTQGDAVDAGVQGVWEDAHVHGHIVPGGC